MDIADARAAFEKMLANLPETRRVALALIDQMTDSAVERFFVSDAVELAQGAERFQDGLRALTFLSTSSAAILDTAFVVLGPDGAEHEVSLAERAQAERDGYLTHPLTGERVVAFDEILYPVFKVRDDLDRGISPATQL